MQVVNFEQDWSINNFYVLEIFQQIYHSFVSFFFFVGKFLQINISDLSAVSIQYNWGPKFQRIFKSQSCILRIKDISFQVSIWVKVHKSLSFGEVLDHTSAFRVLLLIKGVHNLKEILDKFSFIVSLLEWFLWSFKSI